VARVLSSSEGSNRGAFSPADWALFVGLSLVWGSSYLLIALGLEDLTPGVITWGRVALGAATLWMVPRARRSVARSDWPRLVVISFTWTAIPFTLFPLAQQWIASALAGMLNGVTPLAAAVISSAMLRRTPGRAQLVGLVVGLVGVALIGLPSLDGGSAALGVVLVLVASALYGLSSTLAVPLVQAYGSFPVMARMLALATVWTAPLALVDLASNTATPLAVGAVLALGVVGTGLAYVMMATLSGSVGSTRASFITYVIPAVALLLGVAVLGESVAALSVAGAGLVVAGSLLAGRPDPARG
jgi:drug/metabolite transporter (DMT)-like permease